MKGSCVIGCDSSTIYRYNVYKYDNLNSNWSILTNHSYIITSGISNTDLTISKYLFNENPSQTIWKIELIVTTLFNDNQTCQGSTSMQFLVNFSPLPGVCDVLPKEGNTSTIFSIMCNSWNDADGNIDSYAFYSKSQ